MKSLVLAISILLISVTYSQYNISKSVIGNGGGKSISASFILSGTLGQPFTGNSGSAVNKINTGFWYTYSALTDVKDELTPVKYMLFQNYPNPFNPVTRIRYELPEESQVTLKIYNILGELQQVLVDAVQRPGQYFVDWNAAGYSSGFYLCRIEAGKFVSVKKLILLK